jgi:hypothetical protein
MKKVLGLLGIIIFTISLLYCWYLSIKWVNATTLVMISTIYPAHQETGAKFRSIRPPIPELSGHPGRTHIIGKAIVP